MKECRFSKASRLERYANLVVVTIAAVATSALSIYFATVFFAEMRAFYLFFSIIEILLTILLTYFCIISFIFETRKYSISNDGISETRGLSRLTLIKWDKINEICVVVFKGNTSLQAYQKVICIHFSAPPENFLEKIARGYGYALRSMDKFMIIDYSDEALAELRKVYTRKIYDYCNYQLRYYSIG